MCLIVFVFGSSFVREGWQTFTTDVTPVLFTMRFVADRKKTLTCCPIFYILLFDVSFLGICFWRGAGGVSCTWYPSFERFSYLTAFDPASGGGEAFFSRVMSLIEGIDTDSSCYWKKQLHHQNPAFFKGIFQETGDGVTHCMDAVWWPGVRENQFSLVKFCLGTRVPIDSRIKGVAWLVILWLFVCDVGTLIFLLLQVFVGRSPQEVQSGKQVMLLYHFWSNDRTRW